MRHRNGIDKLGLPTDQRIALMRSLTRALFQSNRIVTTHHNAKSASKYIDNIITLAKKGDLSSRRHVLSLIPDKEIVKLIYAGVEKFKARNSGYTRIIKVGPRRGDSAEMAVFELVDLVSA
jgi:large subunit ribosomal protein L17